MALAQIKHRPQLKGLAKAVTSARRRLPRRSLRNHFGLNRPVLATNHLGASYYGLSYDNQGRRATMTKGTGVLVSYAYDGLGRLSSMTNDLAGVIYDISYGFGYNPASQIVSQSTSNAVYDYKETAAIVDAHAFNGLNQDASIAAVAGGYDAGGNMAKDGTRVMVYDVYNRLLSVANAATPATPFLTLDYDVEGRLFKSTNNGLVLKLRYDGTKLISEYFGSGTFYRHYVHGPGVDEPVVWFDNEQFTTPRYYVQNYQGSVIAFTGPTGNMGELYKYGPYGEPKNISNADSWTGSRFRYTGQVRLDSGELYYYKARVYDPKHGRFLQTDPIGSKDDLDLYAYTAGDPVNKSDPSGLAGCAEDMSKPDCDAAMKAQEEARRDIENVRQRLSELTGERQDMRLGDRMQLSASATETESALQEQFGSSSTKTINNLEATLVKIDAVLADPGGVMGKYNFTHSDIGNNLGMTYYGSDTIKLGNPFFSTNQRDRVVTTIHEAGHVVGLNFMAPEKYEGNSKGLPTFYRLYNADDIAIFTYNRAR